MIQNDEGSFTEVPCRSVVVTASGQNARRMSDGSALVEDPCAIAEWFKQHRTRCAWDEFLHRYAWAHFGTLTAAEEWSAERLRREFLDGWVRRAAWHARSPVPWFAVIEKGPVGGRAHLHALVAGTARVSTKVLEAAWRIGNAQVRAYEPQRGGAFYVAKSIPDGCEWYDVSRRRAPLIERLLPA